MSTTTLIQQFVQTWLDRPNWLEQTYHRWTLHRAIARVYPVFARQYPEWIDYFFDEYFLKRRAFPLLAAYITDKAMPTSFELAQVWAEQLAWPNLEMKERHISQLIPVVADFLRRLSKELFN